MHICSFYMHGNTAASHRSPMTIYFKSRGSLVLEILGQKCEKSPKTRFYHVIETKYVTDELNCAYLFFLYAWQYSGITQKPHDHLFQKSWQPGLGNFGPKIWKIPKNEVLPYQWNQIRYRWAISWIFVLFICMAIQRHHTEAPWPFISKVVAAWSWKFWAKNVKNPPKRGFTMSLKPNTLPMS